MRLGVLVLGAVLLAATPAHACEGPGDLAGRIGSFFQTLGERIASIFKGDQKPSPRGDLVIAVRRYEPDVSGSTVRFEVRVHPDRAKEEAYVLTTLGPGAKVTERTLTLREVEALERQIERFRAAFSELRPDGHPKKGFAHVELSVPGLRPFETNYRPDVFDPDDADDALGALLRNENFTPAPQPAPQKGLSGALDKVR